VPVTATIFWAKRKISPTEGEYQGIIYPSGKVTVGIDVWRLLDRMDYPSYETYDYSSLINCQKDYEIINIRKPFWLNEDNETEKK
jgi:hypothetical protein